MRAPNRWRVQLLAGAAMLVAGALIAFASGRPSTPAGPTVYDPPAEVVASLKGIFGEDSCITATDGTVAVRSGLSAIGLAWWRIVWAQHDQADRCVGWDASSPGEIILVPSMDPAVRKGLETFREHTFAECLSEPDIRQELATLLTNLGEVGFVIQAGGAVGGPIDRLDAIVQHVNAGCFVYSTPGFTEDGTRIYWIAGPDG